MAEFQARKKRQTEDWATYGEDLTTLVEKVYPMLQVEAQRLLALNYFLANINNPQLAFGVRQRAPKTLDEAVAAILELETYLKPRPTTVGSVETFDPIVDDVIAATGGQGAGESGGGAQQDIMQKVLEHLEKIKLQVATVESGRRQPNDSVGMRLRQRSNQRKVICWRCWKEGHIACQCYSGRQEQDQGNGRPMEQ